MRWCGQPALLIGANTNFFKPFKRAGLENENDNKMLEKVVDSIENSPIQVTNVFVIAV
jgi:hypothetical protein